MWDTKYWGFLGVRPTFDIFQNLRTDTSYLLAGYGVLRQWSFNSSKSFDASYGSRIIRRICWGGKITTWEELVETFFCRFYPESYDGEDEMLEEGDNWGIDPVEFLLNVNTSFKNHKKVDGITKKVLFHAWMNGNWNKRRIDDRILRSNNATTDSFFKPYMITHGKSDTKKEDEQSPTKRKYSNTFNSIDEQPNKRRTLEAKKYQRILVENLQI
ncbi:hypothetical protein Tco_1141090 [Tanacetum coccineum]